MPKDTIPGDDQGRVRKPENTLSSDPNLYGGRYVVEEELGRGGMGRVFRARDLKLGRAVALKVLAPGAHDERQRLRFEHEARAAGALDHPNIIVVHDVGEEKGEPYIVTELLEGETLQKVLSRGALAPKEVLDLAIQLADGLAAAHAKGIVHRDLKPENLFLTVNGRLKILDFGIAKLLDRRSAPQLRTDTGAILGTVAYMSPEQVRGQRADARSDVFSFGSVVHEMLSGKGPFDRDTATETGYAILHDPPAPLPAPMPELLRVVVLRCLEKVPDDRYADAREILHALGGPRPRRFALKPRRLQRFVVPVVLALAMIAGALPLSRFLGRAHARIESVVVLPLQNTSGDAQQEYLADGMTDALIDELAHVRSLRVISRTSAMTYKGARKPLQQVANELAVDAIVEGSVTSASGRIRVAARLIQVAGELTLWTSTFERPLTDVLTLQTEIVAAMAREMRTALTPGEMVRFSRKRSIDPEAYELYLKARYQQAQWTPEGFENAIKTLQATLARAPDFAEAHALLAGTIAGAAQFGFADPAVVGAWAKAEARRALELDDSLGESHYALGYAIQIFDLDLSEAERELRRAVELSPSFADGWGALSNVLLGKAESVAAAERAVRLDPLTPSTTLILAWALLFTQRFGESVAQNRKALELDPRAPGAHSQLAHALIELGRIDEALEEIARETYGRGKSAWMDGTTAGMLAACGKRAEALALIEPWEARAQKEYVEVLALAIARAQLGDKDKAIYWIEEARRRRDPNFALALSVNLQLKSMLGPLRGHERAEAIARGSR